MDTIMHTQPPHFIELHGLYGSVFYVQVSHIQDIGSGSSDDGPCGYITVNGKITRVKELADEILAKCMTGPTVKITTHERSES